MASGDFSRFIPDFGILSYAVVLAVPCRSWIVFHSYQNIPSDGFKVSLFVIGKTNQIVLYVAKFFLFTDWTKVLYCAFLLYHIYLGVGVLHFWEPGSLSEFLFSGVWIAARVSTLKKGVLQNLFVGSAIG